MDLREEVELLDDEMWMETGNGEIPVSRYYSHDSLVPIRLFHTEYEFGSLHYARVLQPGDDGHSALFKGTQHRVHQLHIVFHPERGVLLVGGVYPDGADSWEETRLQEVYDNLREDISLLMSDLMEPIIGEDHPHPFWSEFDIPIGPAILVVGETAIEDIAGSTPECLIQVGDWSNLPEHLGELMQRYAGQTEPAFSSYSRHLRSAIHSANGQGGTYFDHVGCLETMDAVATWLWRPHTLVDL